MDGTSKDSKSKGVFVRSLSSTSAVETYASIVVAIKFNKARVDSDLSYDGLNTVTVSLPSGLVYRRIPYQDYLKILIAVDQIGDQPLFQTYPEGVFEAARVRLSVLFR